MAEVEIPVGFAVVLSSVMGNRLCLNVRGMLRQDHDVPSVYLTTNRGHNGGTRGGLSRDGRNYRGDGDASSFGMNDLTATELSELRAMRAQKITSI